MAATVVALVTISGLVDGRFADSSDTARQLAAATVSLKRLPRTCGDWASTELELNPEELKVAGATAAVLRRYTHRSTGESVIVLVLCGPPGPISVHPPTACYRARGYRLLDEPQRFLLGNHGADEVLTAEFRNATGFAEDRIGILWGWSTGGCWTAPEYPRIEFADEAALFKLYVTWDRCRAANAFGESLPREFFQEFATSVETMITDRQTTTGSTDDRSLADAR